VSWLPPPASDSGPVEQDEWTLTYDRFDPGHEGLREALCTLGNGYLATQPLRRLPTALTIPVPTLPGCTTGEPPR
jgi:hypothetical protein